MAHHQGGGNRPHHPLWGLVSTPGRLFATIGIAFGGLMLVAPGLAAYALGNLFGGAALALGPFVQPIAFGLVVYAGFRLMFHRPKRGNGRH